MKLFKVQLKFLQFEKLLIFNSDDRWVNSLDPSLNWGKWTEEEDSNLRAAIAEHGHCWAKVAECMPQRTDNMCRRYEVLMLMTEQRAQYVTLLFPLNISMLAPFFLNQEVEGFAST